MRLHGPAGRRRGAGRTPPAEMQDRVSFLELDVTEPRSASAAAAANTASTGA